MATILFLGRLREAVGTSALTVALPEGVCDTESLRDWLGGVHPALRERSVRIAINAEMHPRNARVEDGDEVAFLPPVSGG
jgi:molybdopterin synthase sulfur carrier subunit